MNTETIKDYLVSLGFAVDAGQYQRFNNMIGRTTATVQKAAGSWDSAVKMSALGITGSLGTIAGGTLTLLDTVSRADLGYKLFAMRMHMNEEQAKKLKIATDALGYSIEEIIWNPELRGRYGELMKLQDRLQGNVSGDFKNSMKKIRDIRFEFTKMKVEAVWGVQVLADAITTKLDGSLKDSKSWLERINETLIAKTPEWSQKISNFIDDVKPLYTSFGAINSDAAKAVRLFKHEFLHFDDETISFRDFIQGITFEVGGFVAAVTLATKSFLTLLKVRHGDVSFADIGKEMKQNWEDYKELIGNLTPEYVKGYKPDLVAPMSKEERARSRAPASGASGKDYADLVAKHFPGSAVPTAMRVMQAESRGYAGATNKNSNGTTDWGLYQINDVNVPSAIKAGLITGKRDLLDPEKNIQVAAWLNGQRGWQPWNSSRSRWDTGNSTTNTVTVGDVNVQVAMTDASADQIGYEVARHIRQFSGVLQ